MVELPADRLALGDIVQARPGDRIPCDGLVVEGESAVDESPVTGESIPVARGPGGAVVAGSVNTAALLRIRVTATAADNTLSRIVRMVVRDAVRDFVARYNAEWLIEKNGLRSPSEARAAWCQAVMGAALNRSPKPACSIWLPSPRRLVHQRRRGFEIGLQDDPQCSSSMATEKSSQICQANSLA